jgi:hypothetical protein
MRSVSRRSIVGFGATAGLGRRAVAFGKYGPGVTDAEIKLGTTAYYSGPASTAAAYGLAQVACFQMVNDRGGINGRRVNLVSLDNAFNPPKALEQTRRLVESDEVSPSPPCAILRPTPTRYESWTQKGFTRCGSAYAVCAPRSRCSAPSCGREHEQDQGRVEMAHGRIGPGARDRRLRQGKDQAAGTLERTEARRPGDRKAVLRSAQGSLSACAQRSRNAEVSEAANRCPGVA